MCFNDEKIRKALGQNIKAARLNLNLTQDELSENIDISTQLLKDIEGGRRFGSMNTFIIMRTIEMYKCFTIFNKFKGFLSSVIFLMLFVLSFNVMKI